MEEKKITTVDEYINSCEEVIRPKLSELRQFITNVAPDLKEKISWGMPTYHMKHNVIHFAAHKKHVGLYPGPDAIMQFAERLQGYKTSKGAIQMPFNVEFDKELIKDMIVFNIQSNDR